MTYPELANLEEAMGRADPGMALLFLDALIADHEKSVLRAGVFKRAQGRLGDPHYIAAGQCAYCSDTPLLRTETSTLYGRKDKLIHVHEDPNPSCPECAEAEHDEPWPCAFLRRVAGRYGVKL